MFPFPQLSRLHQGYVNAHPNIGTTLPPWPQAPTQSTQSFQHPHWDGSHGFRVDSSPRPGIIQSLSLPLTPILPLSVYCTFLKSCPSSSWPPFQALVPAGPSPGMSFSHCSPWLIHACPLRPQLIHYFYREALFDPLCWLVNTPILPTLNLSYIADDCLYLP